MAKLSDYDDDLTSKLEELRDRVYRLERQNQALLTVGQNNVTSRSHAPFLETVKEEENEENEDESSLHKTKEEVVVSKGVDYIGCSSFFCHLFRHMMEQGREVLQEIEVLTKRVSDVDWGTLAPRQLVREYKLKRLRKQWRAVIRESVPMDGRRSGASSEMEMGLGEAEANDIDIKPE